MTSTPTLRSGPRTGDGRPSPATSGPSLARRAVPPALPVPVVAATVLTVGALTAYGAEPLSVWNEAYPHVVGHLVSAGAALTVAAAVATLMGAARARGAQRAVVALGAAWALLAGARLLEAVGGAVGDGSGENLVHTAGVVLLGPGLAAVVLAHVAFLLARGVALPWSVRAAVAVTPVAWWGLEGAGSAAFLLLGVAAAAAWLVAGLVAADTARRPVGPGATLTPTAPTAPTAPAAPAAPTALTASVPMASAVAGGVLWMLYGVLELLQPFGPDTRYDAALGYDVVVDPLLFVAYSSPGALAVTLSGVALVALAGRLPVRPRTARVAGVTAVALGVVSGVGVVLGVDPLFTGPRILGTLVLGGGVLAAALAASGRPRVWLALLGTLGVALLAVWPLVYAVGLLSAGAAAGVLVLHGAGWVAVGLREHVLPAAVAGADPIGVRS